MTTEITTLANGLRVVSHRMEHLETLSLGIWVATGARHERMPEHGSGALNRPWFHAKNGVAHGRHFAPGGVPMQA